MKSVYEMSTTESVIGPDVLQIVTMILEKKIKNKKILLYLLVWKALVYKHSECI